MDSKHPMMVLIILVVITTFTNAYHTITFYNLTHVTDSSFFDPTVLKLRNQLLYISYPKVNGNYKVKLESTAINGACEIAIPIPRNHELLSPKATILGNEKIIIAFIETTEDIRKPYITFYVLDPLKSCTSYVNFSVLFDEVIHWSYESFSLIPYRDSFDVFIRSFLHCQRNDSICLIRFNDKGIAMGNFNFNFPTDNSRVDLIQIRPLQEFSFSDGYLVVSKHNSSLTIVDHNLKVLRQLSLYGFVTAYSVLNGDIRVCYHVEDVEPHCQCLKLDSRLKTVTNVSLTNSHYFLNKRLYNLADGSALFVSASTMNVRTIVKRLSADGKISLPEMYYYECKTHTTDTQDRFIELKGGNYCFSFVCKFNMITHCIKSAEANNLST